MNRIGKGLVILAILVGGGLIGGRLWGQSNSKGVKIVVTQGMTLSDIALKYYGSADSVVMERLKMANPEIKDIDLIFVGDTVVLPYIPGYKLNLDVKEATSDKKTPSYMTINRIAGHVVVIHHDNPVPTNPSIGDIVTGGDRLVVKDTLSWIELIAENGMVIRVRGEADFHIKQLFIVNNDIQSKIELVKGAAWFTTPESSSSKSYVEVHAGKINAVSRHTEYSVYAKDGGVVKVLKGEVEIYQPTGKVVVKGGQEFSAGRQKIEKLKLTLFEKWNISLDEFQHDQTPPYIAISSPAPFTVTNKREITIVGETEPGAVVFIDDYPALVDSNGKFSASVRLSHRGLNVFEIKAKDLAGNISIIHRVVVLDLDPPAVNVEYPPDSQVIRSASIKVLGTTEPGAKMVINGQNIGVAPNGYFEQLVLLNSGWNKVAISATDSAGNTSKIIRNVYVDTKPPRLEIIKPRPGIVTRNPRIEVVAATDTDGVVVVGKEPTTLGKDGYYHKILTLSEGPNAISVKAIDRAGNLTIKFVPITVDLTPPPLVLGGILASPVTLSPKRNIEVVGTTEPTASVTVNDIPVKVSGDGQFSVTISLKPGINRIKIVAKDEAGNQTVIHRTVKYVG